MRMRRLARALLLGVCALPGIALAAQTGAAPIQVTTRLVSVDVVVQDAGRRAVPGLTAKDFVMKEDGREQRLLAFTDNTGAAEAAIGGVSDRAAYPFRNLAADRRSGAVSLILFDQLNTPTEEQPYARQQMVRFFERLPEGSRCALFVLGEQLRMVQAVTANRQELVAAVGRLANRPADLVHSESDQRQMDDQSVRQRNAAGLTPAPRGNAALREGVLSYQQRAGNTSDALAELTQAVAGYPGRKNLLWLSGSFPVAIGASLQVDTAVTALPRTLVLPGVNDNAAAMAGSEVAIYPISTRGMASTGVGAEKSGEGEAGPDGRLGVRTVEGVVNRQYDLQVQMEHLASLTGGRAFYNTNDLAGALARSVNEGGHYYRLDYVPENKKWNGTYRRVAVSLRSGGYHLAYRQGYYATREAQPAAVATPDLRALLQGDALEATGILLKANVVKSAKAAGEVVVQVVIDPATVTFVTGADGLRHAKLLLLVVAKATSAGVASPPEKQAMLNIGLEPADYEKVLAAGLPVRQTVAGVTAETALRVGVRDLTTGQVGTLRLQ